MGLEQRTEGKFITIVGGKLCIRVPEGTAGATQRTNKLGKVVNEMLYDSFTGMLVGIKVTDGNYGKQWNFSFKDKGEVYTLQLGYSNSYAKNILKMLPNIDLTKEMKVSPVMKEENGVKKSSLFINQDGNPVKHAFTKDNPNGLPQMTEVTVKGEKIWDDTDQIAFLYDMVMKNIVPKLSGAVVIPAIVPADNFDKEVDEINKAGAVNTEEDPF